MSKQLDISFNVWVDDDVDVDDFRKKLEEEIDCMEDVCCMCEIFVNGD